MRDSQVSSWNRPSKKRVRCVLPERAMYARALCRWVDVGLGARGLGEGDGQLYKMNSLHRLKALLKKWTTRIACMLILKDQRLWMTLQLCRQSEAAFGGPTMPGRGNVTLWQVMRPVQSAPGSLLTHLIFIEVLQPSRHLASRVCKWRADLNLETGVETFLQRASPILAANRSRCRKRAPAIEAKAVSVHV